MSEMFVETIKLRRLDSFDVYVYMTGTSGHDISMSDPDISAALAVYIHTNVTCSICVYQCVLGNSLCTCNNIYIYFPRD